MHCARIRFVIGQWRLYLAAMHIRSLGIALVALATAAQAAASTTPASPAPSAPAGPAPDFSKLTEEHKAALRCAAAFAVVATEQARGEKEAIAYPPLAYRGKEYFVRISAQVMEQAGLSRETVKGLLVQDVSEMQQQAAAYPEPAAELRLVMRPCLERLEKVVAPLKTPDILECSALFSIAADEIHAREGMSPGAADLRTLATVLTARAREAEIARGSSGNQADAAIELAHDRMVKLTAPDAPGGGANAFDLGRCYELSKPSAKSHY